MFLHQKWRSAPGGKFVIMFLWYLLTIQHEYLKHSETCNFPRFIFCCHFCFATARSKTSNCCAVSRFRLLGMIPLFYSSSWKTSCFPHTSTACPSPKSRTATTLKVTYALQAQIFSQRLNRKGQTVSALVWFQMGRNATSTRKSPPSFVLYFEVSAVQWRVSNV